MKSYYLTSWKLFIASMLFTLCMSTNVNAQSISASKIQNMLNKQNYSEISSELKKNGFIFDKKETRENLSLFSYYKKGSFGIEEIGVGSNDELFTVIYKPANKSIYSAIKEKFLTSDFVYSYSYNVTKYYENSNMRIGVNDVNARISFFVILKKY